ncbi:uncharacterized protein [Rutidosis leptorrhynchoides]|uniref:uncharacterized protein n=1 Tax=Rutidosis leptorrhynchoides TaxID=125765 RepID=UPI003A9A2301
MTKKCELCKSPASIYCDSDAASLCWTCDTKVHSANFLVAKHSRTLLCKICQSPTPWNATGDKLSPSSSSICQNCFAESVHKQERVGGNYDEINNNPVASWLAIRAPQVSSSSSSDEFMNSDRSVLLKRKRHNVLDLNSEVLKDELDCSSSVEDKTTSFNSKRSKSEASIRNTKRIRHQNIISGDNSAVGTTKSSRVLELDLNSSP